MGGVTAHRRAAPGPGAGFFGGRQIGLEAAYLLGPGRITRRVARGSVSGTGRQALSCKDDMQALPNQWLGEYRDYVPGWPDSWECTENPTFQREKPGDLNLPVRGP